MQGALVRSLVEELRSHVRCGPARKKKKELKKELCTGFPVNVRFPFSQVDNLEAELLGHIGNSLSTFLRNCQTVFHSTSSFIPCVSLSL